MSYAAIGPIAVHYPERVETNDQIAAEFPHWDLDLICSKTGIRQRYLAAPGECASDLGVAAAEKLFAQHGIDRQSIDYLILCTQTPDYPLPTTACLMQDRLRLPTHIGAFDFNLGCSGFVYGLSMAEGFIRAGMARRVLLVTAETYSKYIHPGDRSLRPIFGDAAAATLIEAAPEPSLGGFVFGTDGSAADTLLVNTGGARPAEDAIQSRTKWRWPSRIYMDGPGIIRLTMEIVPQLVRDVLKKSEWTSADVELYLMHQATKKLLDQIRQQLEVDESQFPLMLESCGNTVSSTLPILIDQLRRTGKLRKGSRTLMAGFGVGFSWAGCTWTETQG